MTGYQALANGIIEQAAKDYRATAMEVERFFHSQWYSQLTQIDPDYLIEKLRKEAVK